MKDICLLLFLFLFQGRMDAAREKANPKADSLRNALKTCPNDSQRIIILSKLDRELRYSNTPEAYEYVKEELALCLHGKNKGKLASAYTDASVLCRQLGDYDKSISYSYKSLELYEETKDTTNAAGCYLNLATAFKAKKDLNKALTLVQKALALFQSTRTKRGIAYCYNNTGTIYQDEHKDSLAIIYFRKALKLKIEIKDRGGVGSAYMNIGIVQDNLKQLDSASLNYAKAMHILRAGNNLDGLGTLYINLGELESQKKNFKASRLWLDSALMISKKLKGVDLLEGTYKALYELNEEVGNSEEALSDFEQYLVFKDSTLNESSSKQVADMGARYESDKKDKDILLLTRQNEISSIEERKQQIFITGLIGIIIGVLLLAFLLFNRFRFRKKLNGELSIFNHQINEQKKEITDSIHYARRIQESILLRPEKVLEILPQSFLLYRPKQIVSGDFYWVHRTGQEIIVAVVDNVLHGVPGAFISLVGINLMNRAIQENPSRDLLDMVNFINEGITQTLKQMQGTESYSRKLNYAICRIQTNSKQMECISTENSIYLINSNGARILKRGDLEQPELHRVQLGANDMVCLFTDGYADQFGGKDGKKFMMRNLEQVLVKVSDLPLPQQKITLETTLDSWKEKYEQVDDILLIGFRV
jgi:serine phosphatase RsbU (regulator of sigma subunit)